MFNLGIHKLILWAEQRLDYGDGTYYEVYFYDGSACWWNQETGEMVYIIS